MTPPTRPLNERLRTMREEAGLTQDDLAAALSKGQPFIAKVERQYYDWLPSPATVRSWAAATGNEDGIPALLAVLADEKASAAREAVRRPGKQDWCSQHRQPRSECAPDRTHVYSTRQRGDLMAEVEREAARQNLDLNAFVTLALENAIILSREGNLRNARQLQRYRANPVKAGSRGPAPGSAVFQEPGEKKRRSA